MALAGAEKAAPSNIAPVGLLSLVTGHSDDEEAAPTTQKTPGGLDTSDESLVSFLMHTLKVYTHLLQMHKLQTLDVDALRSLYALKISFFHGFGFPYFACEKILDTPSWIDIQPQR